MKTLTDLPLEILQTISSFLPLRDAVTLSGTCNALFHINEIKYYFEYDEKEVGKWATSAIFKESVKYLLKMARNKKVNSEIITKIAKLLVRSGLVEELRFLLRDERTDHTLVLAEACWVGNLEIVEMLLNGFKVDPSSRYNTAIRSASGSHYEVVELLLDDPRVDPSEATVYYTVASKLNPVTQHLLSSNLANSQHSPTSFHFRISMAFVLIRSLPEEYLRLFSSDCLAIIFKFRRSTNT